MRAASHDQPSAPPGNPDSDLGACVEIDAVGFDAVAEDDAVFRHQRADAQLLRVGMPSRGSASLKAAPPCAPGVDNIMLGLSHNWVIVLARRKPILAPNQTAIGSDKRSRNSAERPESAAQFLQEARQGTPENTSGGI